MAYLYKNDPDLQSKYSWYYWATKLLKRGLEPVDEIEIHGPHAPPANFMWGTCIARDVYSNRLIEVSFETSATNSWFNAPNLRVYSDYQGTRVKRILRKESLPVKFSTKLSTFTKHKNKIAKALRSKN